MGSTKNILIDIGVEKLLNIGFTNVNHDNILTDYVYMYHFKSVLEHLQQTGNESSKSLRELLEIIESGLKWKE